MWNGLLPIGSVVLLKESEKRIMVIGFCQVKSDDPSVVYDYCGCLYPEGYLDAQKIFLFNHGQVERVYAVGYMDEEQFSVNNRVLEALINLREKENEEKENKEKENEERKSEKGEEV